jgi:hypothetical protein
VLLATTLLRSRLINRSPAAGSASYFVRFPIRYAEVLVGYLETRLESGTGVDQALLDATINRVRGRQAVRMPAVTTNDPTTLRTIIRRERRVEFAFVGIRYFDCLR